MSDRPSRILRPTESQQRDRLAALRSEMNQVEKVPEPEPPPTPVSLPPQDFALVLETEIRDLLALDYQHLPANQRHYLIRAGVALWAARNAKGPVWGEGLNDEVGAA